MRFLERAISHISPAWALSRAQKRAILNRYEAAEPSSQRFRRTDRGSGDASLQRAGDNLRMMARDLEQNHDLVAGALSILVNNVVGRGIRYEPAVMSVTGELHEALNEELAYLFRDWAKRPDVTGQYPLGELERIELRSMLRDGDVFAVHHEGNIPKLDHGTIVPYSVELLESDYVPLEFNDASRGIRMGVEKNAWGKPRAYHIFKSHPGDLDVFSVTTKRVKAESVTHLMNAYRIRQTRGVTILAPVLTRLDDLKDFEESERLAARLASRMVGKLTKGMPDMYDPNTANESERKTYEKDMKFYELGLGEDVEILDSNRPHSGLDQFRSSNLKAGAAALNVGYSSWSKNYDKTYSGQRQENVEQDVNYGVLEDYYVRRACEPRYERFVRMAVLGGLEIPPDVDMRTIYDVICSGTPMPHIDPLKEINADVVAIRNGLASPSSVIRKRGGNPRTVLNELERDQKLYRDKNIELNNDQIDRKTATAGK